MVLACKPVVAIASAVAAVEVVAAAAKHFAGVAAAPFVAAVETYQRCW